MPTMTTPEKVVEYIGYSSAALEKAAAAMAQHEQQKAACAKLIPDVIAALLEDERIVPAQREKAAQVLADPVQALHLLIKVAKHRNARELSQLGEPVGGQTKTAGATGSDPAQSLTSANVGARSTMVKQSDVNFFRRLGLSAPTGT